MTLEDAKKRIGIKESDIINAGLLNYLFSSIQEALCDTLNYSERKAVEGDLEAVKVIAEKYGETVTA